MCYEHYQLSSAVNVALVGYVVVGRTTDFGAVISVTVRRIYTITRDKKNF